MYFMMWYKPYMIVLVIHYNSNIFYVHGNLAKVTKWNQEKKCCLSGKKLPVYFTRNGIWICKCKAKLENSESSRFETHLRRNSAVTLLLFWLTETLSSSCFGNGPKLEVNNMNCYLCGKSASSIECHTCHQAWFCSHEHLEELHRPPLCFPIKVATSEVVGRYLVASRDLAPLDLILSDTATPSGK